MIYNIDMESDLFIIILVGIIHASLQLGIGTQLLLYHASLGKHIKKRTRGLVTNYILGNGFLTMMTIAALAFVIFTICSGQMSPALLVIAVAILVALALSIWLFYYRWGKSTELWLPKSVAKFIDKRANVTESNTEAFGLGMLACFAEAPFTLILVIVAANSVINLPEPAKIFAIILYTLLSVMPTLIVRVAVRRGQTIVDVQRWRIKNKLFIRTVSGIGFLVLAIFILAFKVFGA